jgi:hypothetical protein
MRDAPKPLLRAGAECVASPEQRGGATAASDVNLRFRCTQ